MCFLLILCVSSRYNRSKVFFVFIFVRELYTNWRYLYNFIVRRYADNNRGIFNSTTEIADFCPKTLFFLPKIILPSLCFALLNCYNFVTALITHKLDNFHNTLIHRKHNEFFSKSDSYRSDFPSGKSKVHQASPKFDSRHA